MITCKTARVTLKNKGWSQRKAAKFLGRTQTHISLVLCGHRPSRRLLRQLVELPDYHPNLMEERTS
jgi:transcriptional regulator with XRE-family HTH domain